MDRFRIYWRVCVWCGFSEAVTISLSVTSDLDMHTVCNECYEALALPQSTMTVNQPGEHSETKGKH